MSFALNFKIKLEGERFVPKIDNRDAFYWEHITRYTFAKPYIKGKKVLDLGCGTGYGSFEIIKIGAAKVIGIDISKKAINFAQKNFRHKRLSFRVADATSLPFKNNSFDTIVSFEVIEHIKNYHLFLNEVFRVLKKGGHFIFSTPNSKQFRGKTSAYHFKEFTGYELLNIFSKRNQTLTLFGQSFKNHLFTTSQKQYFQRYQSLTLGGNKLLKKMIIMVPAKLKTAIYELFWQPIPQLSKQDIIFEKKHLNNCITLIGICRKI